MVVLIVIGAVKNTSLINYQKMKGVKKIYETTPTLCKNGVTRPITRVHLEKECPVYLQSMRVEKDIKGSIQKRRWLRWRCVDKTCNHSELEEGEKDMHIREGAWDDDEDLDV